MGPGLVGPGSGGSGVGGPVGPSLEVEAQKTLDFYASIKWNLMQVSSSVKKFPKPNRCNSWTVLGSSSYLKSLKIIGQRFEVITWLENFSFALHALLLSREDLPVLDQFLPHER